MLRLKSTPSTGAPRHRSTVALVAALCTLLSPIVQAATYYVSLSGSDSNAGTQAAPFRTIARGLRGSGTLMQPGDILYIRGGTYAESIESNNQIIPTGTSWSNAPRIAAYPGESVTLRNLGLGAPSSMGQTEVKYVIFDGLHFKAVGDNDAIGFWGADHHIRIQNCEASGAVGQRMGINMQPGPGGGGFNEIINTKVHHNGDCSFGCTSGTVGHGVYVAMSNNLFDGLESYSNGHLGLQVYSDKIVPSNNIIRNSIFHDNSTAYTTSGAGVTVGGGDNNQVYNNIIYASKNGIKICCSSPGGPPTNTKVYNNTLYGNQNPAIEIQNGSGALVRNNILWNNGGTLQNSGSGTTASNNLTTDPRFADAANRNFHLTSASIDAIDQGFTVSAVTTDFDGVSRPQGSDYDIGAFEYSTGSPIPPMLPCDLNGDSSINVTDVQLCANQAIGAAVCTSAGDINKDSACNVIDVQRVVNAALGGTCVTP